MSVPTPARATDERASVAPGTHEHRWALMRFELVDDHPFVRQECETCGLVRRYRAWDRSWTPGVGEARR